jgi:glutamine synthetase type III
LKEERMNLRKHVISNIANKKLEVRKDGRDCDITAIYGQDVFNLKTMKDYLPKPVYRKLMHTIRNGATLDPTIADDVSNAMKRWALSRRKT